MMKSVTTKNELVKLRHQTDTIMEGVGGDEKRTRLKSHNEKDGCGDFPNPNINRYTREKSAHILTDIKSIKNQVSKMIKKYNTALKAEKRIQDMKDYYRIGRATNGKIKHGIQHKSKRKIKDV